MARLDFLLNLHANTSGFNQGVNGARSAVALLTFALATVGLGLTAKELLETADATQLLVWNRAGGKVMQGLVNCRAVEQKRFKKSFI